MCIRTGYSVYRIQIILGKEILCLGKHGDRKNRWGKKNPPIFFFFF